MLVVVDLNRSGLLTPWSSLSVEPSSHVMMGRRSWPDNGKGEITGRRTISCVAAIHR